MARLQRPPGTTQAATKRTDALLVVGYAMSCLLTHAVAP
jgi:hypothetical protein